MTALIRFSKPCDECGGTGVEYPSASFAESHPLPVPCPSCVGGFVPSDELVDSGVAIKVEQNCGFPPVPWDVLRRHVVADLLFAARAEARYQSEESEVSNV